MPAFAIAGIAAAATIGGAVISSNASKNSTREVARITTEATDKNNALQLQVREENKGILAPYGEVGTQATGALNSLLYGNDGGASLAALQTAPGYQFRQQQGNNALNTQWAARGMLQSGAARKASARFNQDYASGEYGNRVNQLMQQQGVGLSAGNALAGVNTNFTNNVTGQNNALAGVLANGALANGQATGQMWGSIGGALGQFAGSYSSYKPPTAQPWYGGVQGGGWAR